ncbi:MAG TPA: hypothetical protein PLV42_13180 [bacterium]|nr:hypothetical protein [bacterium]
MHEKGSTLRPSGNDWSVAIKQFCMRRKIFITWLFFFVVITIFYAYEGLIGNSEVLEAYTLILLGITCPVGPLFAFFEFSLFYSLDHFFSISLTSPFSGWITEVVLFFLAGYVQWAYLVPELIGHLRKQKLSPMTRIDSILMLFIPLAFITIVLLASIIFWIAQMYAYSF